MSRAPQQTSDASLNAAYLVYTRQLDQQEDTHQASSLVGFQYQAKARARQLDTLLNLSHFSDYLVLITAPSGAGKTTFMEQFFRAQPADATIVHLVLDEAVTAPWVVGQLVGQLPIQLPDDASLDASILAIQELAQQLTVQQEVLLIVVDDAQWLDEDALELLANLLPRSAKLDSRPHVILCADQSVVERIESPQFAELRQERFYHLVLAPFSQEESAEYLRQRLERIGFAHGLVPIQLLQLHQLAKGNPGYLNMLANKALNKGGFVQQAGLPLFHIAATLVVVLVLAGIWVFNYLAANPASLEQLMAPISQPVVMQPHVIEPDEIETIAQALPPLEPIQLSPASANISLKPAPPVEQMARLKLPSLPKATATTRQPYTYSALLQLPREHYSLQVLGARLETTLEAFLQRHKVQSPYYVIQLERAGEPWYLLLVGDYANANEARSAIGALPVALRNQQPWPRPVLKIQQQIRNKFNTGGE